MRVIVVSDTHAPGRWRGVPGGMLHDLRGAEAVLHAGDVTTPEVLDAFAAYAPVHVALGNCDGSFIQSWGGRLRVDVEIGGVRIGIVHDSGPEEGRAARLRQWFPDAHVAVFGHTHTPHVSHVDGLSLVNPGSLTSPRSQPWPTYGVLEIDEGRLQRVRIERLTR